MDENTMKAYFRDAVDSMLESVKEDAGTQTAVGVTRRAAAAGIKRAAHKLLDPFVKDGLPYEAEQKVAGAVPGTVADKVAVFVADKATSAGAKLILDVIDEAADEFVAGEVD